MYEINFTDGRTVLGCRTHAEAVAAILAEWPDGAIGHDGDLTEGGDRTLAWASEEDSVNDAGQNAVASIRRV